MTEKLRNIFIIIFCCLMFLLGTLVQPQQKCDALPKNFIGNNRLVAAYDGGKLVRSWTGQIQPVLEDCSLKTSFLYEGKRVDLIGGLIIIEEL